MKPTMITGVLLAMALAATLAILACGGGEPEEVTIAVEIEHRELKLGADGLQVKDGDMVTFIVTSDEHGAFHLHGYDLEADVGPGAPAVLKFTANATGSFPFTIHVGGENQSSMEHEETAVAPEGMSVKVEATPDGVSGVNLKITTTNFTFTPENVNGHHVEGEGHAHVYVDGKKIGRLYGNYYHLEGIEPGEHEIRVTLNANGHEQYAMGHHAVEDSITVTAPGDTDSGGHGHGGEAAPEEEIELGRLEVRPR